MKGTQFVTGMFVFLTPTPTAVYNGKATDVICMLINVAELSDLSAIGDHGEECVYVYSRLLKCVCVCGWGGLLRE